MGSAFTPVKARGSPPSVLQLSQVRPNKRTRQHRTSTLDVVDEEPRTADAATVSTAASEVSSKGSNGSGGSQPPLLDFIGNTCYASSAWFTSCFPCAVVDINDRDDYVVDKLSRESAMNVMYPRQQSGTGRSSPISVDADVDVDVSVSVSESNSLVSEKKDANMLYIQLPGAEETTLPSTPPAVIAEDESPEDDALDAIPLGENAGVPCLAPETPELPNAGIADHRGSRSFSEYSAEEKNPPPHKGPPKKKKKRFGVKMFGRKNKQ